MTVTVPRPKRKTPVPDDESIVFSIRWPGWLYNAISKLSDQERRTLNAQIQLMIERQVEGTKYVDPLP